MNSNLLRFVTAAAILTSGGASLALAQGAPSPDAEPTIATPADPSAEGARIEMAQAHGDRNGDRDHGKERRGDRLHRGGPDGAQLGAFGPGGPREMLAAIDADGNGAITQAEVDAYLAARVAAADVDGDGAIALDEFEPVFAEQTRPRMVDAFQALDADGSGTVTEGEIDARFGDIVERLDRDDDGALSPADRSRRG